MALTCTQLEALLCMFSQCATEGDFIVFYNEKASPLRCEARGDFNLLSEVMEQRTAEIARLTVAISGSRERTASLHKQRTYE